MNIPKLPNGKKAYFASDFHLGAPAEEESALREQKIVSWLDRISEDAQIVFLVGDLFDFWFEYRHVIPKGYVRFLGKLAQLSDSGIDIIVFTGNHDIWIDTYLEKQLGAQIVKTSQSFELANKKFYVAHGDGFDPKDWKFKIVKKVFTNRVCQALFRLLHPDLGIFLANTWSSSSREDFQNPNDDIHLIEHSNNIENQCHHDYYIYGDCHYDKSEKLNGGAEYFNLGDWINKYSYLEFDGTTASLKRFQE